MKLADMLINAPSECRVFQSDKVFTRDMLLCKVKNIMYCLKKQGLNSNDRVMVCMTHDVEGIAFLAAASALGLQVFLNYNLESQTEMEIKNAVILSECCPFVLLDSKSEKRDDLIKAGINIIEIEEAEVQSDIQELEVTSSSVENFLVLFTSGSTGKPKAISVSEDTVCKRIKLVSQQLEFNSSATIFMSGLLSNTTGIIFSFGAFLNHADLLIPINREIHDWIFLIDKFNATHIMLRPAMMELFVQELNQRNHTLPSLKVLAYGAAAMPEEIIDMGRKILTCKWIQGYGLSETFGPFIWLNEEAHCKEMYKGEKYCIGVCDGSLNTRIAPISKSMESGELEISGDVMMNGYLDVKTNSVTTVTGWFKTGDIANVNTDANIILKGRIANTVLTKNGHCTYPEEIEAVINNVPGISECFLMAAPEHNSTSISGSILCVSANYLSKSESINAIVNTLERELSKEKWPDWIYYSSNPFLRGANEKILKKEILAAIDLLSLNKVRKE